MIGLFKKNRKVLDTSMLIDGRIVGVIETGFLEGDIVVPFFVIMELHSLIDSANPYKAKKGEMGLKTLEKIKALVSVEISHRETKEMQGVKEVDTKLILLCRDLDAKLMTVDFKLNEVARMNNIDVLNINDLNNSIKPIFIVGDIIEVRISRAGKEPHQGIGNLDDGTMVIVRNGATMLDAIVKVKVGNVGQSKTGRIIFADLLR